jgi:hypothetical protein
LVGIAAKLTDAELVTVAVTQALPGFTTRPAGCARTGVAHLFRYLPKQPGYNKRPYAASAQLTFLICTPAVDTAFLV